jgi:hypothetical protein
MLIYQINREDYFVHRREGGSAMLNRNHSSHRYAWAIGTALVASLLVVVASLVQAASHVPAYLS